MYKNINSIILVIITAIIFTISANANKNGLISWSAPTKLDSKLDSKYEINIKGNNIINENLLNTQNKTPISDSINKHIDGLSNLEIKPVISLDEFISKSQTVVTDKDKDSKYAIVEDLIDKTTKLRTLKEHATMTVVEAIRLSFNYQSEFKAQLADFETIKLLEKASYGNWYPTIEFFHSHNLKNNFKLVTTNPDGTLEAKDANENEFTSSIRLTQNLNFNELGLITDKAGLNTKSKQYDVEKFKQTLSLSVVTLFLETLRFRDKLKIAQQFQDISKEIMELVELRYKAGVVALLEKKKLELGIQLTTAEFDNFNEQLKNSLLFLGSAIGAKNLKPETLILNTIEIDNFALYSNSLHKFVKDNIEYKIALNQLLLAQNNKKTLKSELYPSFDLSASVDKNQRIEGEPFNKTNLALNVSYFLYKGGIDHNKFKSGSKAYEASEYRLKATENRVRESIEKSFIDYEQEFKKYNTFNNSRAISWDLFNIQYKSFQAGKNINLTELLASLTTWYNNYLQSRDSYYALIGNKNKFSVAIGRDIVIN